jgi:TRAP-type C4-dicarboxylate transport system permease small subunit
VERIFHWIDQVCRGGGVAAALALLTMSLITFYEVLMRYVFNRPTIWVHEVGGYMLVVIGLLGAAYTLLHERHVRVDLVLMRLPRRVQAWLNLATYTLALVFFFAFLTYYGGSLFLEAVRTGSKNMFGILETPYWLTYWMVPFGGLLVCLQLLSRIYHTVVGLRGKQERPATEGG